jgi:hypothetical protein
MPTSPLDPTQFRLWHRLRRLPRFVFIGLLGSLGTSAAVVLLHAVVGGFLGARLRGTGLLILFLGLAVVVGGAFAWTRSYMERRYRATRSLLCPRCGYAIHAAATGRCPERGEVIEDAAPPGESRGSSTESA